MGFPDPCGTEPSKPISRKQLPYCYSDKVDDDQKFGIQLLHRDLGESLAEITEFRSRSFINCLQEGSRSAPAVTPGSGCPQPPGTALARPHGTDWFQLTVFRWWFHPNPHPQTFGKCSHRSLQLNCYLVFQRQLLGISQTFESYIHYLANKVLYYTDRKR